jgi:hypothetical protein
LGYGFKQLFRFLRIEPTIVTFRAQQSCRDGT